VRTDGSAAYRSLGRLGYRHTRQVHLDAYLDEFVFRFNRRTFASRGLLFYRVLQQALATGPLTGARLVQKAARPPSIKTR
jgi:hypothetical protein